MTRDLLGKRIKKVLSGYEQTFMEKFYVNREKIYQIVRVNRILKMDSNLVEITYIQPGLKRTRRATLTQDSFENRKHFHTYAKAKNHLSNI
jgi:hypothetical protein